MNIEAKSLVGTLKAKLSAQGIIWFHDRCLMKGGLIKRYDIGNIQEIFIKS